MSSENYYKILGVKTNASQKKIKEAYRKLVKKYHPDKHGGDKKYEEYFKKIQKAYEVLSDKETRQKYDQLINKRSTTNSEKFTSDLKIDVGVDKRDIIEGNTFNLIFTINTNAGNIAPPPS